jgi:predicted permease
LLVRSWINGAAVDPGFSTENVLLVPISSNQSGAKVEKPPDFEAQLIARVASAPDVPSVTAMDPVPLWFGGNFAHFGSNDDDTQRMGWSRVGPQYFRTLRLRLVQGREFTAADNASAPQVAIVNETFARQFFPGANAIGRTIRSYQDTCEVVGIAADVKYRSLADAPQPWVYRPLAQEPTDNASLSLAVRFDRDTPELRRRIERDIRALAPAWPVVEFRSLDEGLKLQRLLPRTGAAVLGVLGTFALVLAAVGIYGVTAYVVTARAREMGIRLALGSPPAGVTALVIRQVMWVCVPGAVVGTVLAAVAGQLMTALLVSTSAADPATFVVIPMTLLAVAVLAAYLPARRAARTHPLSVLRAD